MIDDPNRASTDNTEIKIITLFTLGFLLWSAVFIYRTSFIAIDGKRYFCLFDDAMISMRYAWNFSHGAGLVWNAGERVQGYTNLLMTLLMSLATLFFDKSIAALAIQILGVGFMLGIGYAVLRIADYVFEEEKNSSHKKLIRILSFIFALSYYPLTYWTETGMETGLLTVLLLSGVLFVFRYRKLRKVNDLFTVAIVLGLAFLTRNDSLIFAVLIWGYLLWEILEKKGDNQVFITFFSAIILYLIFIIGQFLFQYLYYGEFLPNTYTLKLTGMSLPDMVSNGIAFVFPFLIQVSFILVPAILEIFMRYRREKLLLLTLFLSSLGYQIYVGGDPWNYWRMMSPTTPLLGILFIGFVSFGIHSQGEKTRRLKQRYGPDTQVILLVLIGLLVVNVFFLPEALFLDRPFYVSANEHNVNIAVALREVTTPEATLGVFWAGAIPYFTERRGIDFLGKSDRYIAHLTPDLSGKVSAYGVKSLPGHNKYDLNYSIQQLQPTYVQSFKWGTQDLTSWAESIYVSVDYKGVSLYLLRNSPAVLWDRMGPP